MSTEDLKKKLSEQVDLEDWKDECGKCGYPCLLHRELHREAACTQKQELPDVLRENWKEYRERIKPILRIFKEEFKKDIEQGVLLNGLTKLIESNTQNTNKQTENMTSLVNSMKDSFKKDPVTSDTSENGQTVNKVTNLTKPAKVPS